MVQVLGRFVPKFDFQRFDGVVDPTPWVCRGERYYHINGTCEAEKVLIGALHLEGDAQMWF